MKTQDRRSKVVVLSGSGISAESGIPTFRDSGGLWNTYSCREVASLEGWKARPETVLAFYNERRIQAWSAQPNAAHLAIASLEQHFEVVVITQNVDNLHERAGSSNVIHVHGQLAYAKGSGASSKRYLLQDAPILMGQLCEEGTQLRPDIVWFGERVQYFDQACDHVSAAEMILVVGTSLSVFPAADLVSEASAPAKKVIVSLDYLETPFGFVSLIGKATEVVPTIVNKWICEGKLKV